MSDYSKRYHDAMIAGNTNACIRIEQEFGLFGYPPEMVSVGLKAADEGQCVDAAIEAYIAGEPQREKALTKSREKMLKLVADYKE